MTAAFSHARSNAGQRLLGFAKSPGDVCHRVAYGSQRTRTCSPGIQNPQVWTLPEALYRQSLGLAQRGEHWLLLPEGHEHVLQKHPVWWPKALTYVEQKPALEPVLAAQLSASRMPRLSAQMKCTFGVGTLVPSAEAQTPLASMLPHVQAPVPAESMVRHFPAPHPSATMPCCASHRTQVSPAQ